jgi:lipopolysaccharide transport system ATP-binding protein
VEFSGIEKFLDTPLKHYSSGMRLRLAFSVAAHLEPEILLIDEILAVGDAEFQKKCLGKMDEVSKSGRTVIFVSHNLGAVNRICTKGLLIEKGQIKLISSIKEIIEEYQKKIILSEDIWKRKEYRSGNGNVRINNITLLDDKNNMLLPNNIISGEKLIIKIDYNSYHYSNKFIKDFQIGLIIRNHANEFISVLNNKMTGNPFSNISKDGTVFCIFEKFPFMYGHFNIMINLMIDNELSDRIDNALSLFVVEGDYYNSWFSNAWKRNGVYTEHKWSL